MRLLTIANTKTVKGQVAGYLTGILYLAPHKLSGKNMCPHATAGCIKACLNTAGRGQFTSIQEARLKKTRWLLHDRFSFVLQLIKDIQSLKAKAKREGLVPCVRLNGTSDLRWELIAPELFTEFSDVQFYDYTKYPPEKRAKLPANYHLTFSATEHESPETLNAKLQRGNAAIVVSAELKDSMLSNAKMQCVDGDKDDLRFLDPAHNYLVLLTAKGKAKRDTSGFVIR